MPLLLGEELPPAYFMSFDAHSNASRVNVIMPGTGYRGEGNHHFLPAYGNRADYIRRCVIEAIEEEAGHYARRGSLTGTVAAPRDYSAEHGTGAQWASDLAKSRHGVAGACRITVTPLYGARGHYRVTVAVF